MGGIMSKRFLRWVETWIEESIPPGANPDIESHEAKTKRLSNQRFARRPRPALQASRPRKSGSAFCPLVLAPVSDSTDFDIDAYRLKSQLAEVNEDGD